MRRRHLVHMLALGCMAACSGERTEKDVTSGPGAARRPSTVGATTLDTTLDTTRADSAGAVAALESLKAIAPPPGEVFNASLAPRIDPASVLAVVSDSGLTLHDVNEEPDTTIRLTRQEIEAQLARRSGRAFRKLVHLAYLYSQPYPQYSRLAIGRVPGGLEVQVGNGYELTFVREGGRLRLRRVSYGRFEG
jgi:hypothetical protein